MFDGVGRNKKRKTQTQQPAKQKDAINFILFFNLFTMRWNVICVSLRRVVKSSWGLTSLGDFSAAWDHRSFFFEEINISFGYKSWHHVWGKFVNDVTIRNLDLIMTKRKLRTLSNRFSFGDLYLKSEDPHAKAIQLFIQPAKKHKRRFIKL